VKDSLTEWLKESNYALLDGTFYSGAELPGRDMRLVPHPTIKDSLPLFSALPPSGCEIFFTHFNHTNPLMDPDSRELKELKATPFRIAQEWDEFDL
jgi:pyrroloquinoline quinone biosynthesis protein B